MFFFSQVNRPIEQIRFNPEQALRLPTDDVSFSYLLIYFNFELRNFFQEITAHLRLVNNGPDKVS